MEKQKNTNKKNGKRLIYTNTIYCFNSFDLLDYVVFIILYNNLYFFLQLFFAVDVVYGINATTYK